MPTKQQEQKLTVDNLGGLEVRKAVEAVEYLNMIIYGNPGVGKTVLAGSADDVPELRPVLFIDVEGGTLSLRHLYPQVEVVRVTDWADMQVVYDALWRGETSYRTVVLDSITEMQKFSMNTIMKKLIRDDPDRDPDVPGMREWGKNIEQVRRLVRGFRDLEMHTIITALPRDDRDQRTGVVQTKPSLSGKVANEVAGFVDMVGYMHIRTVEEQLMRLIQFQGTETKTAKDRSDTLPSVIVNPTMADIFAYVYGKKSREETEVKELTDEG